tara:strand:- start:547 stop:714 length:168 start_codon:yes stop_codon:yes gene_type:complete
MIFYFWYLIDISYIKKSWVTDYLIMQVTGIKSLKTLQGYIRFDKKLNKTIAEAWD